MAAEGEGRLPVDVCAGGRGVLGKRVGDHVGGGEGASALQFGGGLLEMVRLTRLVDGDRPVV